MLNYYFQISFAVVIAPKKLAASDGITNLLDGESASFSKDSSDLNARTSLFGFESLIDVNTDLIPSAFAN